VAVITFNGGTMDLFNFFCLRDHEPKWRGLYDLFYWLRR
jgi:hypothetical protein